LRPLDPRPIDEPAVSRLLTTPADGPRQPTHARGLPTGTRLGAPQCRLRRRGAADSVLVRMAVDSRHSWQAGAALLKQVMLMAVEVAQSVGVQVLLRPPDNARSLALTLDAI
jgi:hypothetical protein